MESLRWRICEQNLTSPKENAFYLKLFSPLFYYFFFGIIKLSAQNEPVSTPFRLKFGKDGIISLKYTDDKYDTESIAP